MRTCCPYCQTYFRVTPAQLKKRMGKVRCGLCSEVFDALDTLNDENALAKSARTQALRLSPESSRSPSLPGDLLPDQAESFSPQAAAAWPQGSAREIPEAWVSSDHVLPPPKRSLPWIAGICLLSLLACAQLLYIFRIDLAARFPRTQPLLGSACSLIGCKLPRPIRPDRTSIEISDLSPEGEGLLLTASLKNRAPYVLDFPYIELTLTGARDAALVRRALTPGDYLPASLDPASGFAPGQTVDIQLRLLTPGVSGLGYRLYLFYP